MATMLAVLTSPTEPQTRGCWGCNVNNLPSWKFMAKDQDGWFYTRRCIVCRIGTSLTHDWKDSLSSGARAELMDRRQYPSRKLALWFRYFEDEGVDPKDVCNPQVLFDEINQLPIVRELNSSGPPLQEGGEPKPAGEEAGKQHARDSSPQQGTPGRDSSASRKIFRESSPCPSDHESFFGFKAGSVSEHDGEDAPAPEEPASQHTHRNHFEVPCISVTEDDQHTVTPSRDSSPRPALQLPPQTSASSLRIAKWVRDTSPDSIAHEISSAGNTIVTAREAISQDPAEPSEQQPRVVPTDSEDAVGGEEIRRLGEYMRRVEAAVVAGAGARGGRRPNREWARRVEELMFGTMMGMAAEGDGSR